MILLKWLFQGISLYVGMVLLAVVLTVMGGCIKELEPETRMFFEGQCVQMKIDHLKGMVVIKLNFSLWVRFSHDKEMTNTHIFGQDGDIDKSPYALVQVYPIEVEPCK